MDWHLDEATPPIAQGAVLWDDSGYLLAVADSMMFWITGEQWRRLAAYDRNIQPATFRAALTALALLGAQPSFGDGDVPLVPLAGAPHVVSLRDQLRRIRAVAPYAFGAGPETFTRIVCTDRWPRIYTTAVLDTPARSPVRVIQASDLEHDPAEWLRVGELAQFTDLRVLILSGAPIARWPLPLDLAGFRALRAIDLAACDLRSLPASLARTSSLEAIELANNPIGRPALDGLARLPALRYVGLRGTEVTAFEAAAMLDWLPDGCEVVV